MREVTGLNEGGEVPDARIIDRTQWIRAATQSMRVMTGGSDNGDTASTSSPAASPARRPARCWRSSRRASSASTTRSAPDGGELLLVYPNVIAVERQLRVQPADFRLWVCLHEVTHRVQFRANPWLADHMSNALAVLTEEAGEDITEVIGRLADFVRDRRDGVAAEPNSAGVLGVLRAVQSEPQQQALDQLLVLGTLLEGHADHVMDAVGPAVVPSVATIRRRFNERRTAQAASAAAGDARVAGLRRQDQPVHPRQGVRRPRGRQGRHGPVQHDLVEPRNTAAANRNRRASAMDRQGALSRAADRGRRVRPPLRRRG